MIHVVLYEPEIPQNTGNIARTCAATGCMLHLIEPMGFKLDDRQIRRAGLDYWPYVVIRTYKDWGDFTSQNSGIFYYCTTKAEQTHAEMNYPTDTDIYFIFGKESHGLPEPLLARHSAHCIRIPMREDIRSLNLSNSVAVIVFECLRQRGFEGFTTKGKLTGRAD